MSSPMALEINAVLDLKHMTADRPDKTVDGGDEITLQQKPELVYSLKRSTHKIQRRKNSYPQIADAARVFCQSAGMFNDRPSLGKFVRGQGVDVPVVKEARQDTGHRDNSIIAICGLTLTRRTTALRLKIGLHPVSADCRIKTSRTLKTATAKKPTRSSMVSRSSTGPLHDRLGATPRSRVSRVCLHTDGSIVNLAVVLTFQMRRTPQISFPRFQKSIPRSHCCEHLASARGQWNVSQFHQGAATLLPIAALILPALVDTHLDDCPWLRPIKRLSKLRKINRPGS
jgi:hypothetical protein